MPTFELTDKSGAVYQIDAPNESVAVAALGHMSGAAPMQPSEPAAAPAAAAAQPSPEKSTLQTVREAIHSPTRILENGFLFGLGDRARAGMDALIGNGSYGSNFANERAQSAQFASDHPIAAPVIEGVGGIATPLGALGAAAKGTTLGAKTVYGLGAGATLGGVQGAFTSSDLTDLGETGPAALKGGAIGGALGAALPGSAQAVGSAYNAVANALRGRAAGLSRDATGHLVSAVESTGMPAVQARVSELGPQAMLADANPALLGKAQGAALNSDDARTEIVNSLTNRNTGTNQRIMGDVNGVLGPAQDPQLVTNDILARRSALDNVAYPAALNTAKPVEATPLLEELNARIPKSVGMERRALENLRGMLTKEVEKEAAPVAAATVPTVGSAPAAPVDTLARDVADIRAKYGDVAAAVYERQQRAAAAPVAAAAPAEPKPQSLLEFLASKGGLGPDAELNAIGAHSHTVGVDGVGRRKLVKQGGFPLDYAREAAEEAGYLSGNHNGTSTVNDLLDAIDAEMRGQKLYPRGYEGTVSKREASAMSERERADYERHIQGIHEDLASAGYGDVSPDVRDRAASLMADRGMSADRAVEHASIQLEKEAAAAPSGFPGDRPLAAAPAKPTASAQDDASILHKVKQELDAVINYDAPGLGVPAGALQHQQGSLKLLRGKINALLEGQVPGYAQANAVSHALANQADAVKAGTQYLGSGKTIASPQRFASEFGPLSAEEKAAFAQGSRGEIDRILGTKANDLQALKGELQGEGGWNTAKIAQVHGQDAADALVASVDRNLKFRDTYNKVVENSQTAQRQAAAKAMKPDPSSETPLVNPNMTLTGVGGTLAKKAAVGIANALLRKDPTASYGEIAKVLTAQGDTRDAYIRAISDVLSRRQANAALAPVVGDRAALIAAILGNGYGRGGPRQTRDR